MSEHHKFSCRKQFWWGEQVRSEVENGVCG